MLIQSLFRQKIIIIICTYMCVCDEKLAREMKAEASLTMELLKSTHTRFFLYYEM